MRETERDRNQNNSRCSWRRKNENKQALKTKDTENKEY